MNKDISISSDWRSEVRVKFDSEAVVERFFVVTVSKRKVDGLIHAPCGHDSDQLVEVWVTGSFCFVKRLCKLLRCFYGHFEAKLSELVC